jgi:hypothetical protein
MSCCAAAMLGALYARGRLAYDLIVAARSAPETTDQSPSTRRRPASLGRRNPRPKCSAAHNAARVGARGENFNSAVLCRERELCRHMNSLSNLRVRR